MVNSYAAHGISKAAPHETGRALIKAPVPAVQWGRCPHLYSLSMIVMYRKSVLLPLYHRSSIRQLLIGSFSTSQIHRSCPYRTLGQRFRVAAMPFAISLSLNSPSRLDSSRSSRHVHSTVSLLMHGLCAVVSAHHMCISIRSTLFVHVNSFHLS